ncbi:MAG: acetyl-CoA acetyltransferase, partial [Desulfurococcales archaeon]|nr:acetyl-CoA acetyltransferase [Desulfurococcales archaeon]
MVRVGITGTGAVRIGRSYPRSVFDLAAEAAGQALEEAGVERVDIVVAATSLSYLQNPQLDFASYLAGNIGLQGVKSLTVEAGEGSGLAALEVGYALLKSGAADSVLVVGADKL